MQPFFGYQPQYKKPENPFTAEAQAGFQKNPFQQGTREYDDFQNQQVRDQTDLAGMPKAPSYIGAGQADTGSFMNGGNLSLTPGQISTPDQVGFGSTTGLNLQAPAAQNAIQNAIGSHDTSALDKLNQFATSNGISPWARLQLMSQRGNEAHQLDETNRAAAGANAEAQSNLAMRGGLTSGAGERVQTNSMEDALKNMQGVRNAGEQQRLGILSNDESNKLSALKDLPGAQNAETQLKIGGASTAAGIGQNENALASDIGFKNIANDTGAQEYNIGQQTQASQYNINNALSDLLQQRGQANYVYGEQAKAYGAEKTGQAVAQGGKK